jgi:hypothetical protein
MGKNERINRANHTIYQTIWERRLSEEMSEAIRKKSEANPQTLGNSQDDYATRRA